MEGKGEEPIQKEKSKEKGQEKGAHKTRSNTSARPRPSALRGGKQCGPEGKESQPPVPSLPFPSLLSPVFQSFSLHHSFPSFPVAHPLVLPPPFPYLLTPFPSFRSLLPHFLIWFFPPLPFRLLPFTSRPTFKSSFIPLSFPSWSC